jgi:hypothetical protein
MEYKTDRDIPDTIWNNYMRVYDNKYKVYKDEAGVYHLKCRYGSVYLHSMINHKLSAVLEYKSMQGVEIAKRTLTELAGEAEVTQEGVSDVVIVFSEFLLDKVAGFLQVRYKRRYSEEQKKQLVERFKPKEDEPCRESWNVPSNFPVR